MGPREDGKDGFLGELVVDVSVCLREEAEEMMVVGRKLGFPNGVG